MKCEYLSGGWKIRFPVFRLQTTNLFIHSKIIIASIPCKAQLTFALSFAAETLLKALLSRADRAVQQRRQAPAAAEPVVVDLLQSTRPTGVVIQPPKAETLYSPDSDMAIAYRLQQGQAVSQEELFDLLELKIRETAVAFRGV